MKTFIFIPDTNNKAGLGHLYRCFKYSNFVRQKYQIIFLIKKDFDKKYLIKKNQKNQKIKYFFYSNLEDCLILLKCKYKKIITFLDTYNSVIRRIKYKKYSDKHINILDFKAKFNSDYIIDHTFDRKDTFHKKDVNIKIEIGLLNFPIFNVLKTSKKNLILVNFGSIKNKNLVRNSLIFLKKLNLNKSYKIILIDKFFLSKDITSIGLKNKIFHYKFLENIDKIYVNTFFSIGACGISLYERSFFNIPSISKCVAKNQYYNFKNFYSKGCILDFNKIITSITNSSINNEKFFKEINKVKKNLRIYFDYKKNRNHLHSLFNRF